VEVSSLGPMESVQWMSTGNDREVELAVSSDVPSRLSTVDSSSVVEAVVEVNVCLVSRMLRSSALVNVIPFMLCLHVHCKTLNALLR
jgi:hypothetical protein